MATRLRNVEMVKILLGKGAKIDRQSKVLEIPYILDNDNIPIIIEYDLSLSINNILRLTKRMTRWLRRMILSSIFIIPKKEKLPRKSLR